MRTKEILLKMENNLEYWVRPISEGENEQLKLDIYNSKLSKNVLDFKHKYKIDISNIEAHGDVKVNEKFISQYIPYSTTTLFGDKEKTEKSCKCYAFDHDIKLVNIHRDCCSSWNCVLSLLNNPKFVLIYTKKHETI